MRLPLLAALLCAAVGASALPVYRIWRLPREQGKPDLSLTELENGSVRFALEYTGEYPGTVDITKQEAAELGRALLEAAGQPERVCPNNSGLINIAPEPIRGIYKGTYQADPWILDGRQCRPIPCPEGRVGCAVNHMVCDEEKKP